MRAALAARGALAADEDPGEPAVPATPRSPLRGTKMGTNRSPEGKEKAAAGAPHVLIVRTPDGRLTWLQALGSRRKGDVAAGIPAAFTGLLMTDGYTGYQHLLSRLRQHPAMLRAHHRRCRAVVKLGPSSLRSWAGDIIGILREAHQAVEDARARGSTAVDADLLGGCRERYDDAVAFGITHNRLGPGQRKYPGYALGCWLRGYKEQVFLFARNFAVDWTTNVAERGESGQAPPGRSPATGPRSPPSPAGAHQKLPRLRPPPTASPRSTPSAPCTRGSLATTTARRRLTPITARTP